MGTRISFRYKNENKTGLSGSCVKAIRFWGKGFCIAVYEPVSREILLVEEHQFEEDYPLNGKLHIMSEAEGQLETGDRIRFVCFNRPNTQIPENLFNAEEKKIYLQLLTANPYLYTPVEEKITPYRLYNLSAWEKNLYHGILSLHPDCRMQSGMSLLLQMLHRQEGVRKIAAFVEDGHLDIAAAEGDNLLGANSFSFQNTNDFLYFFTGFAHTMFGSTERISVRMGGEVEPESMIFNSVKKYFPSLDFIRNGFQTLQEQHRYCDLLFEEQ